MATVTVHDALRLALPIGTTILAGASGLQRTITWPVVARAVAPLFTDLRGHEFALVSTRALRDVDPPLSLTMLIERLSVVPVAAIAVVGKVETTALGLADQLGIPLLQLTDDVDIRDVDREMQRLVSDFEAQTDRRAAQIALEMGELALTGAGIPAMINVLANRTGRMVSLYNAKGELFSADTQRSTKIIIPDYAPAIGMTQIHGYDFCCEALRAGEQVLGYIVIIGIGVSESDKATIKRATMALALEYSKSQALSAVEARFRGNFVEQVLAGQLTDPMTVQQRAREFGYDLRSPQRATILCCDALLLLTLQTQFPKMAESVAVSVPWIEHEAGILCFLPAEAAPSSHQPLVTQLIATVRSKFPTIRIVQGRVAARVDEWKQSVDDAQQVRKLPTAGKSELTTFESIGVYQLLLPMIQYQDAYAFYRRHLGVLLDYDRDQNAELMQTLFVYFEASGNLARTAEALHVHRNTLLYRLTRISQICKIDLEDPETRLSIWISVKFHALYQNTHSSNL